MTKNQTLEILKDEDPNMGCLEIPMTKKLHNNRITEIIPGC